VPVKLFLVKYSLTKPCMTLIQVICSISVVTTICNFCFTSTRSSTLNGRSLCDCIYGLDSTQAARLHLSQRSLKPRLFSSALSGKLSLLPIASKNDACFQERLRSPPYLFLVTRFTCLFARDSAPRVLTCCNTLNFFSSYCCDTANACVAQHMELLACKASMIVKFSDAANDTSAFW